jgi:hypothetical protein
MGIWYIRSRFFKEFFYMNCKSKVVVNGLVAATLVVSGLLFSSCNRSQMYDNYKNFGNGYEAAQKGKSAPFFWSSNAEREGYEAGLSDLRSGNKQSPVEFKYTKEEIKSLENRWNTFEEMMASAFKGDCDAMFAVGLSCLYGGKGLPINTTYADMFFAKAASLGHVPSLEKIRGMYNEQISEEDFAKGLLQQVYVNLIIAMGHTEYTMEYHKLRTKLIETLGEKGRLVMKEVERIAHEKMIMINQNLIELEKDKGSEDFFTKLNDITMLDRVYDNEHWASIMDGNSES